jgi:hypothetical protein
VLALLPAGSEGDSQAELMAVAVCPGGAESVPLIPDLAIA